MRTPFQQLGVLVGRPQLALAAWLFALAGPASARQPMSVPEPTSLSLAGIAVVAGIIAWRIRNKK